MVSTSSPARRAPSILVRRVILNIIDKLNEMCYDKAMKKIRNFIILTVLAIILIMIVKSPINDYFNYYRLKTSSIVTRSINEKIDNNFNVVYTNSFKSIMNQLIKMIEANDIDGYKSLNIENVLSSNESEIKSNYENASFSLLIGNQEYNNENIIATKNKYEKQDGTIEIKIKTNFAKTINFTNEYEYLNEPIIFDYMQKQTKIKGFGIQSFHREAHAKLLTQTKIYFYNGIWETTDKLPVGIILGLSNENNSEEIIISTLKTKNTIFETFNDINEKIRLPLNDIIDYNSTIQIPILSFYITSKYDKISLSNNNSKVKYEISNADETISFNLAKNLNKPYIYYANNSKLKFAMKSPYIIIDRPFVIYAKDKNAKLPYFFAYVCNDELLMKY